VESQIEGYIGRRNHVILEFSTSKANINEAVVVYPHNGYTDPRKSYENGLYSADDDYTGLILVVESQIGFVERRNMSYWNSSKVRLISMKLLCCSLTTVVPI